MIVTVTTQKGGEGKTTTSVSIAHRLAMRNHLVLLVDRDHQLNTVDVLGLRTLEDTGAIEPGIYETGRNGLHLYPAGNTTEIDLLALAKEYDVIVVDTPPDEFVQKNTLPYSDFVIVPAKCESLGVRGAKATLAAIKRVAQPEYVYILPTMYRGTAEHERKLEMLADMEGAEVAPYIPLNGFVSRNQGDGKTIYEKGGRGMLDLCHKYDTLVDWIEASMSTEEGTVTIC